MVRFFLKACTLQSMEQYTNMKHSADVTSHRLRSSINSLAIYALENELSRDVLAREIDKRFLTYKINNKDKILKDVIQSCYALVWNSNRNHDTTAVINDTDTYMHSVNGTTVMTLASCIISTIQQYGSHHSKPSRFSDEFYALCLEKLLDSTIGHYDTELLTIYIKQAVIMLKTADIIKNDSAEAPSTPDLYNQLLLIFWNKCNWKQIFPSGGHLSNEIKRNRHILLDILLSLNGPKKLHEVAQIFFELTDIVKANDIFAASLLDFTVLTWLSFFGIIEYVDTPMDKPVTIMMTKHARSLLQPLQL